jgi:FtsP/CotA-like multicopper oxidase with cupredoxin domain
MQGVINDFQDDGAGVGPDYPDGPDEPIAFFVVTEAKATAGQIAGNKRQQQQHLRAGKVVSTAIDVDSLVFTPGIPSSKAITNADIEQQLTVTFQVLSSLSKMPVPQFVIDGAPFDYRNISATFARGSGAEWTVASAMNYFHPIHIHVNPFQVMNMTTGFMPGTKLQAAAMSTSLEPWGQWRDTALVLPFGETIIRQRYSATVAGKTVFHCHYLDHEDQGMMKAMMIK